MFGSAGTAYVLDLQAQHMFWICMHSICFGSAGTAYALDLQAQQMLWICRHSICLDLQAQHMLGSAGTAYAWICRHIKFTSTLVQLSQHCCMFIATLYLDLYSLFIDLCRWRCVDNTSSIAFVCTSRCTQHSHTFISCMQVALVRQ